MSSVVVLLVSVLCGELRAAEFAGGPGAAWRFTEAEGACALEQRVPDFGSARFTGLPGRPLRFELLTHRDLFAEGPVTVQRVAPPWHPEFPRQDALGDIPHRPGAALLVADPLATRMLMDLYAGYETHLKHEAWFGAEAAADAPVDVRISSVQFRVVYERFVRCFRGPAAQGWTALERSRIEYAPAASDLGTDDEARLRQVARYVTADPAVTRIFVDGHTDAQGAAAENLRLSRRRAEAVREFLLDLGVPESRIVVRYHGARYPVADNATEAGRARNRRTTVRLEREWEDDAGEVAAR